MKIRISSRKSDLARAQAIQVAQLISQHCGIPSEFFFKESLGDKNLTDPLWKIPERGVFTEDFVEDLHSGKTDIVVHSWKDLPTEPRPGLAILCTPKRADPRDLLLVRKSALGKKQLKVLTSSPRRAYSVEKHLRSFLPFQVEQFEFQSVRGNVPTRIRKLFEGEGDILLLAKAGLDRLLSANGVEFQAMKEEVQDHLNAFKWMVLPLSYFPSAPAQGALAIEGLSSRADLKKLFAPFHCQETEDCVRQERATLNQYGGGCHQKIGITVLSHPKLGKIEFFLGSVGQEIHAIQSAAIPREKNLTHWPDEMKGLFERIDIPSENPGHSLFVTRFEALPRSWNIHSDQLLWTAGVETWKKLAAVGYWVNGTCDGLGEELPTLNFAPTTWTKLTHDQSKNETFPLLATYHLKPKANVEIPLVDSYFWPSESTFDLALSLNPEIIYAKHAAGPGYTAEAIARKTGKPVSIYFHFKHWKTGEVL